jgi:hypothetical protein
MRIWLSGPRILWGLIRPGISFSADELTRRRHRPMTPAQRTLAYHDMMRSRPEHRREPGPAVEKVPTHVRVIAWVVWLFAVYGFYCAILAVIQKL